MKLFIRALVMVGLASGLWLAVTWSVDAAGEADSETLALGGSIYAANCATCHGANLEGQPDWKSPLASGRFPAPPHDASGHTWHHPEEVLFRIVKEGTAAIVGGGYQSDMPGFGEVLSDEEIQAVLAYIKGTWPERERSFHERVSRAASEE